MTEPNPLILVIEDEAQMRRFLRASLTSNGYQVVEAETAEDGLAQAAAPTRTSRLDTIPDLSKGQKAHHKSAVQQMGRRLDSSALADER